MRILHTYCLNHNLGDYYLGIGVKNLLRAYLPVDLIGETNLQGTVFDEYYIDEVVNKKYQLLVIGGGGVIHGAHWPNGWFWLIREELIRRIQIPFIIYGVGYNYFPVEGDLPEVGRKHLIEAENRALHFSVRNDGSMGRLREQTGLEVEQVPDPGFHVRMGRPPTSRERQPFVLIQVADDKSSYRFPNRAEDASAARGRFITEMRAVVFQLSKRYEVIFSPHVFEDIRLSEEISSEISNTKIWDFSRYAFDRAHESLGLYGDAAFVIAMRGHGQIVPISLGTPVISIENHPKHEGLMRDLGLQDFNVSIHEPDLAAEISSRIEKIESGWTGYSNTLSDINQRLTAETHSAFSKIASTLKGLV